MERFFIWPLTGVAVALSIAVGAVLLSFVLLGARAPILLKLGTRNIARRQLRAALIVVGLMLSATVVGTAFGTGDTMTHTLRSLITASLGSVDEVVVLDPPRTRLLDRLKALPQPGLGALAAADLSYFPQGESARLASTTPGSRAIAGLVPAIVDQVTLIHQGSRQLQLAFPLLAVPSAYPAAFGGLESVDGTPVTLESLGANTVVLNAAAAELFHAGRGDELAILHAGERWSVRIGVVTRNTGLAGMDPLLIMPLANYQQLVHQEGQINIVLVSNGGGSSSVERSEAAAQALRQGLADKAIAQQLHVMLARPDVQRGLRDAEGSMKARDRSSAEALRLEAARPELTERFVSLISDPGVRRRLFALARNLPSWPERRTAADLLQHVARLSVLEAKQEALDQANEYGAVITTVFLVLGIFSIAAAILLIFLIFALLAADRGPELATMRALGMRRRQIMAMFLFEGLVYDLLGAALGTVASLGAGYLIIISLARALEAFGIHLDPHVDGRSLIIAFAIGVLLSVGAMLIAVWRVSRLAIIAATRGEASAESRSPAFGLSLLLLLSGGFIWWEWGRTVDYMPRHPLIVPASLSLVLLGASICLRSLLAARRSMIVRTISAGVPAITGAALAAIWLRTLLRLPTPGGETSADAVTLAIGGLVLIPAIVYTAAAVIGPLLKSLDHGLWSLPRVRAILRPAAGYLGQQRWRTGMAVVMFGAVVCIMVIALSLITVVLNAYAGAEPPVAGFDLRGDLRDVAGTPGGPIRDIEAELRHAPAISRAAFGAIGGVTLQDVQLVQLGLPAASWQASTLAVVDDGFLRGIQAAIKPRVAAYHDTAGIWAALREHPGTAVVSAALLSSVVTVQDSPESDTMSQVTVWIRPNTGGGLVRLAVIGVIDPRSELDEAIYTSRTTAGRLGIPLSAPSTYFFAVRPSVRVTDAAEGLRVSFDTRGLAVVILGDVLRLITSVRLLLTRLVQSFMALGLVAGIAALGLLGLQSVLERRQQLGTLRALGFTCWQIRSTLALETAVVAVLGITLGVCLGLILTRCFVAVLAASYPEVRYIVPWKEIALTASTAWLGSTLSIALAAWDAGRVSPADALRVA